MCLASHYIFACLNMNTVQSDRVHSRNQKEVCLKTGFSLAVFDMKSKVEFVEQQIDALLA